VVDLCAGLAVADCADWLFSKYHPPVFEVLRVFVGLAHVDSQPVCLGRARVFVLEA